MASGGKISMAHSHEHFDHTADMGLRCWGDTREEVVRAAIEALYAAIGELKLSNEPDERAPFRFESRDPDPAMRLRDLLAELLLRFECEGRRLGHACTLTFDDEALRLEGFLWPLDEADSHPTHEVKAVTYHDLELRRRDDGWEATVIVDI